MQYISNFLQHARLNIQQHWRIPKFLHPSRERITHNDAVIIVYGGGK